jgi:transcriptional regulator with XRE-family HTH domain
MGYRGKLAEHDEARRLRAQSWTLEDIAARLGVSKSSVSTWVRDVEFVPSPRRMGARRRGNRLHDAKLAEIARLNAEGVARIGDLSEREFLVAGLALYAGEGAKTDGEVRFTNTDPSLVAFHCAWIRHFFDVDESRLRLRPSPTRRPRSRSGRRLLGRAN